MRTQCNRQNQAADSYNESALTCSVSLKIPQRMRPPIFIYYELDGVYQNHRRCAAASVEGLGFGGAPGSGGFWLRFDGGGRLALVAGG